MNGVCEKNMTLNECELQVIRNTVEVLEAENDRMLVRDPDVQRIVEILEGFLRKHKLVCYGGTAINTLLPKEDQFYDYEQQIPDYDFYSPTPVKHAKQLANIYFSQGFDEVEAKAGMHHGTYKVYVNFIPIADITMQPKALFETVRRKSRVVKGIHYAPPNLLRMGMYLELSRPRGDVSRWEKVARRLQLLNKHHPITPGGKCPEVSIRTQLLPSLRRALPTAAGAAADPTPKDGSHGSNGGKSGSGESGESSLASSAATIKRVFIHLLRLCVRENCVFFGGFANSLYSQHTTNKKKAQMLQVPDFDILHHEPEDFMATCVESFREAGFGSVKVKEHEKIGEIVAPHFELVVNGMSVLFAYKPLECHSYNPITISSKEHGSLTLNIATIDTMLSFYLAFIYGDRPYYDPKRILCMCETLLAIQRQNRFAQKGILRRFGGTCFGDQSTKADIRKEKSKMFAELRSKRHTPLYESWFLSYKPTELPLKVQDRIRKRPASVLGAKALHGMKSGQTRRRRDANRRTLKRALSSIVRTRRPKRNAARKAKTTRKAKTRKVGILRTL
jgi:hypothetical protein